MAFGKKFDKNKLKLKEKRKQQNPLFKRKKFCRFTAANVEQVDYKDVDTLKDFVQPDGELGYFSKTFDVYDREGRPCACGGKVKRIVQGGRSTFFCPKCQR
jgi:formamidopyrimidine-DNA glycosylase